MSRRESAEQTIGTRWDAETTGLLRIHFPARPGRAETVLRLTPAEARQLHRSLGKRIEEQAATEAFARNKRRVESGDTYAAHKPSSWRRGSR